MRPTLRIGDGWLRVGFVRRLNCGAGAFGVSVIVGADADLPLRPWPTLWAERRGLRGHHVCVALVWCGVGVMVQTHPGGAA